MFKCCRLNKTPKSIYQASVGEHFLMLLIYNKLATNDIFQQLIPANILQILRLIDNSTSF